MYKKFADLCTSMDGYNFSRSFTLILVAHLVTFSAKIFRYFKYCFGYNTAYWFEGRRKRPQVIH